MRVLGLDTATLRESVAVVDGARVIVARDLDVERGHTRRLMSTIDACLHEANLSVTSLDLLAVGLGPGSFTGLRIGVSVANAIGFAARIPVVGVSSLAAIAWGREVPPDHLVVTAIDARKQEVYAAVWEVEAGVPRSVIEPVNLRPEALATAVSALDRPCVGLGNAFVRYARQLDAIPHDRCRIGHPDEGHPRGQAVADLGKHRYEATGRDERVGLEPRYIRQSDAELNWSKT